MNDSRVSGLESDGGGEIASLLSSVLWPWHISHCFSLRELSLLLFLLFWLVCVSFACPWSELTRRRWLFRQTCRKTTRPCRPCTHGDRSSSTAGSFAALWPLENPNPPRTCSSSAMVASEISTKMKTLKV